MSIPAKAEGSPAMSIILLGTVGSIESKVTTGAVGSIAPASAPPTPEKTHCHKSSLHLLQPLSELPQDQPPVFLLSLHW